MSADPNEIDVLRDVTSRLDAAHIPFMLTGSLAMNFYAQPRMTRDIDLVIQLPRLKPTQIAAIFEPDYYVSVEGIVDAVAHSTMFNVIHHASVIKVYCIIRKDAPFRIAEFGRRRRVRVGEFETWIASKEDLILSKLSWQAESGSERQMDDVRNLIRAGFDEEYISYWAYELGLTKIWSLVTAR